jgi:hypothetical protein
LCSNCKQKLHFVNSTEGYRKEAELVSCSLRTDLFFLKNKIEAMSTSYMICYLSGDGGLAALVVLLEPSLPRSASAANQRHRNCDDHTAHTACNTSSGPQRGHASPRRPRSAPSAADAACLVIWLAFQRFLPGQSDSIAFAAAVRPLGTSRAPAWGG